MSDGGDQDGHPVNLWVSDYQNDRIVHLRYNVDGKIEWINSIGNFYRPIDIAYRAGDEGETPAMMYVATEKGEHIIRIPLSNEDIGYYQNIEGYLQEGGIDIGIDGGFLRPTGICLNRSGDRDGWVNTIWGNFRTGGCLQ